MNAPLFTHTWRSQRVKLAVVSSGLAAWGFLMPLIYARFGSRFKVLLESGMMPDEFARLGGGDIFSLPGSVALGFIHPIPILLGSVFAVGFSATAVAGERQRGTLELVLARPLSRRGLYATLLAAVWGFIAVTTTALLTGVIAGSAYSGVLAELALARLPLVWVNGVLLFGTLAAFGLAASVSFDRVPPALGVTIAFSVLMYFLEILGSLWPDAAFLQPYSLFHYLQPRDVLLGASGLGADALLAGAASLAVVWALVVFPIRDLPAPS